MLAELPFRMSVNNKQVSTQESLLLDWEKILAICMQTFAIIYFIFLVIFLTSWRTFVGRCTWNQSILKFCFIYIKTFYRFSYSAMFVQVYKK